MSVINKVLRDLDQRKASPADGAAASDHAALRAGTQSVAPVRRAPLAPAAPRNKLLVMGGWALIVAGAGAVAWWHIQGSGNAVPVASTQIPAEQPVVASPAPAVSAPVAAASVPTKEVSTAPLPVFRMESQLNLKGWVPAGSDAPVLAASAPPASKPVAAQVPVQSASEPAPVSASQRQQAAGREALAQAQSLWNGGAHDAALDLLQEAIATVERNLAGNANAANTALLASLVREWARMQLADARSAPVWELLSRLEPQLRNEADLWAVRANAAQRLGRHQDSVFAYVTALQFRPNEQRWMLGAAVSLAASGQTTAAAEMVEKARAVGAISPEVQAYLRQAGVPLGGK